MLYDPKWQKPSLASFIGWLESKDPKAEYDFQNCQGECLIGQYMTAIGIEWGETPLDYFRGDWSKTNYIKTGRQIFGVGTFDAIAGSPWTFGAALERTRKLV